MCRLRLPDVAASSRQCAPGLKPDGARPWALPRTPEADDDASHTVAVTNPEDRWPQRARRTPTPSRPPTYPLFDILQPGAQLCPCAGPRSVTLVCSDWSDRTRTCPGASTEPARRTITASVVVHPKRRSWWAAARGAGARIQQSVSPARDRTHHSADPASETPFMAAPWWGWAGQPNRSTAGWSAPVRGGCAVSTSRALGRPVHRALRLEGRAARAAARVGVRVDVALAGGFGPEGDPQALQRLVDRFGL